MPCVVSHWWRRLEVPCVLSPAVHGIATVSLESEIFPAMFESLMLMVLCRILPPKGTAESPKKLNITGEYKPWTGHTYDGLHNFVTDNLDDSDSLNGSQRCWCRVVIVGGGLTAADAVITALTAGCHVYHAFDPKHTILSQLSERLYPEYSTVWKLMSGERSANAAYRGYYTPFANGRILKITSDHQVRVPLKSLNFSHTKMLKVKVRQCRECPLVVFLSFLFWEIPLGWISSISSYVMHWGFFKLKVLRAGPIRVESFSWLFDWPDWNVPASSSTCTLYPHGHFIMGLDQSHFFWTKMSFKNGFDGFWWVEQFHCQQNSCLRSKKGFFTIGQSINQSRPS